MTNECRSCGAPIRWAITEKGRRMPLDPDPHPDGNVMVEHAAGADHSGVVVFAGRLLHEERDLGTPLYRSHFASCPDARKHRRR